MQPLRRTANPFVLLTDPQSVIASMEHSERLARLQRRICRPLDKPLLAGAPGPDGEGVDAFDRAVDAGADDDVA